MRLNSLREFAWFLYSIWLKLHDITEISVFVRVYQATKPWWVLLSTEWLSFIKMSAGNIFHLRLLCQLIRATRRRADTTFLYRLYVYLSFCDRTHVYWTTLSASILYLIHCRWYPVQTDVSPCSTALRQSADYLSNWTRTQSPFFCVPQELCQLYQCHSSGANSCEHTGKHLATLHWTTSFGNCFRTIGSTCNSPWTSYRVHRYQHSVLFCDVISYLS